MGRITVNLTEEEQKLKNMIQDLRHTNRPGNPYYRRSESEIAKMILEPALIKEHKKHVKDENQSLAM